MGYVTLSLCLGFLPVTSQASQLIYTIQTGSFINIIHADQQFQFIMLELNEKELDYLRIEKVGQFYAVRLGKFDDYISAEKFLEATRPQLSSAIILKAYIKDERTFVRFYRSTS